MSETAAIAPTKKAFTTMLTNVNDTFMPLIMSQMQQNRIEMTAYSKQCVLHAISAINAVLEKAGVSWNDQQLDKSNVVDILMKIACFQLNAAASPREVYFQTRNVKKKTPGGDLWVKQVEMGIEGDGNDALLARFGRDVVEIGKIWKVREGDEFTYPTFSGLDMDPPKWSPRGQGKLLRVVYPIIKAGTDGKRYVEFYIAERADVIRNLVAHINSNLMNETFGLAESKFKANAKQKADIEARKRELLKRASDEGLDAALDDQELQPWISPAWTEYHSREAMIERKLRNNAIKKIPKDFANGAMETMFEEATDDVYRAAAQEIAEHANSVPVDVTVDEETGEVTESRVDDGDGSPEESPEETERVPRDHQEPPTYTPGF